jgi:DNA gyrase subunit B
MRKLIDDGRIFVARPPLFKVTHKKEARFVQTREQMSDELMGRGLKETTLTVAAVGDRKADRTLTADELAKLLPLLAEIEKAVEVLERRGHSFSRYVNEFKDRPAFPLFHVRLGGKEHFFGSQADVDEFRVSEGKRLGRELTISEVIPTAAADAPKTATEVADEKYRFTVDEWHEVKGLNKAIAKLKEAGFEPADLIPLERVAGREAPVRFRLTAGDATRELSHLRALLGEIRKSGEKGMTITRFKGLGEMNPDELWETTLDPSQRTLLRVTMTDAMQAEKYFRMLMGTEVDGRREFILKHRANVEDIDYGA